MERLTVKLNDGTWALKRKTDESSNESSIPLAVDRLAAYEDTGLEPEEIKTILERYHAFRSAISDETGQPLVSWTRASEICRAEKDGRLVVLPCKVGDRVYRVITTRDAAPVITEIEIKTLGQAADMIGRIGEKQLLVSWYSTREEAEAALKKRKEDNEAVR